MNRTTFFQHLVKTLVGVEKTVLDAIGGSLRRAGMISIGGRGLHAPDLTIEDARNIMLGLMATDNARQAAKAVERVSVLTSSEGKSFGAVLNDIFANPELAGTVSSISVFRNFDKAVVYWSQMDPDKDIDEPTPRPEVFFSEKQGQKEPALQIEACLLGNVLNTIVSLLHQTQK